MAERAKKKTNSSKKSASKKRATSKKNKKQSNINAYIAVNAAITVLTAVFMYVPATGVAGKAIKGLFMGLFGNMAYTLPAAAAILTYYIIRKKDVKRYYMKLISAAAALMLASAVFHLPNATWIEIFDAYECGALGSGGGLAGALIACSLTKAVGVWAAGVILILLFLADFCIATKISLISVVTSFLRGFSEEVEEIREVDASDAGKKTKKAVVRSVDAIKNNGLKPLRQESIDLPLDFEPNTEPAVKNTEENIYEEDIYKNVDLDTGEIKQPQTENEEILNTEPTESAQNYDDMQYENHMFESDERYGKGGADEKAVYQDGEHADIADGNTVCEDEVYEDTADEEDMAHGAENENEVLEFVRAGTQNTESAQSKAKKLTDSEQNSVNGEIGTAMTKPVLEYKYPPIDLLTKPQKPNFDARREMRQTSVKLVETFKNFGINVKVLQVTQGPAVTRYEIQPDIGVKLSKITALADDLALNLAVPNVLIAPVPGKAAIGVEIPNQEVSSVAVRELIESPEFKNAKSKLAVALGKDIGGRTIIGDIAKMPHVLVAGATGSGKSVCINTLITSILYRAHPDEVKLIMIDPKVVELGIYNGIPHLLIPVVTDPKRAAGALGWAVQEMMKRYDLFAENKVRNLSGYNQFAQKSGIDKLPQIVIIIDELADLMMVAAKEVEDYVCRLAQLARAAGIHIVIATQRPSVDVITGLIKANVPSRIAFAVSSQVDSRTILGKGGAEKLLGKGDMLYHPSGMPSPVRVQGAFVSDEEVENIVEFLKENTEENSFSQDLADHIERCSTGENGVTPDTTDDGDKLLPTAIELAMSSGQISTSMIQRRLNVGYARAGRIIDQMEARGIISGADGSKPRQVIARRDELM